MSRGTVKWSRILQSPGANQLFLVTRALPEHILLLLSQQLRHRSSLSLSVCLCIVRRSDYPAVRQVVVEVNHTAQQICPQLVPPASIYFVSSNLLIFHLTSRPVELYQSAPLKSCVHEYPNTPLIYGLSTVTIATTPVK